MKELALNRGFPILQPQSLKGADGARAALAELAPDLIVVVAYGLLLPRWALDLPRRGCINVHASLLPRWRGAAPIAAAILAGDAETGVAIMRLEEGLDTGPVAALEAVPIAAGSTCAELSARLADLGAELLARTLGPVLDGSAVFEPQATEGATYAPKLSKADAPIDWREPAMLIERRIRAYNPWPVAETRLDGRQLRCWLAQAHAAASAGATPGTVIGAGTQGIEVVTGAGTLRLLTVQLEGRKPLPAGAFAQGHALVGKLLGA